MDYVFPIEGPHDESRLSNLQPGDAVTLLVVADRSHLGPDVERSLEKLRRRAALLASQLSNRGVHSKVLIEWGSKADVAKACAQREKAKLL